MQRPSIPWFWILLPVLFLVLPGPARRLLLDLLGGLTLTLLLLPLLVGGLAVLGWQILRRRLRTCEACGFSSLGSPVCPACGTPFTEGAFPGNREGSPAAPGIWKGRTDRDMDARNVTINVEAVDVGLGSSAEADQTSPPGS
jgi:hypothetical protein